MGIRNLIFTFLLLLPYIATGQENVTQERKVNLLVEKYACDFGGYLEAINCLVKVENDLQAELASKRQEVREYLKLHYQMYLSAQKENKLPEDDGYFKKYIEISYNNMIYFEKNISLMNEYINRDCEIRGYYESTGREHGAIVVQCRSYLWELEIAKMDNLINLIKYGGEEKF